jgi:hypothetical protein
MVDASDAESKPAVGEGIKCPQLAMVTERAGMEQARNGDCE